MANGPLYRVPFRRRREGRTDYRTRLALVKGGEPRVVVRKSLNNLTVQVVRYNEKGDEVVAEAQARELKELGWTGHSGNTSAAYLTGLLAGKRAKEAGVTAGILDIGLQAPVRGSGIFAALAGALEAGLEIPHGEGILPDDGRIRAEHIQKPEVQAAFAQTFEKIAGRPVPPKKEAPKKKGDKGKGAPAPAPAKVGKPQKSPAKPATGAEGAPKDKKAKSPGKEA